MTRQSGSSKYCLDCRYFLDHLKSNECPECGREFDASDSSTYSTHIKTLWPRWEIALALLLCLSLYYFSWHWDIDRIFAARRSGAWWFFQSRLEFLGWLSPAILVVPVLLISGLRSNPRNKATIALSITCAITYLACRGTHLWYGKILSHLDYAFREEGFWEAFGKAFL